MSGLLTRRQREILQRMLNHRDDDYEGELVYERGRGYLGDEAVAGRTVNTLIRLMAISLDPYSEVGKFERYHINETGVMLLREAQK